MLESTNEINLRTLKRFDLNVENILHSATQVALYDYVFQTEHWKKLQVEGALFIVSKHNSLDNNLIIINRLNTQNLNETIEQSWELILTVPFLMFKNGEGRIRCIWFYDENECQKTYLKLKEFIDKFKDPLQETFKKLGIVPTIKNDSDQLLRKLMGENTPVISEKSIKESSSLKKNYSPAIINQSSVSSNPTSKTKTLDINELFNINQNATSSVNSNKLSSLPEVNKIQEELSNFVLTPALLKKKSNKGNDLKEGQSSPPQLFNGIPEQIFRPKPTSVCVDAINNSNINKPNNLTMEQLKQTLIYLLQNDADFLHTIYKTFNQRDSN